MFGRRALLVVLVLICASFHSYATNANDATGAPTNITQLFGPGGDTISAYSGDMEIAIPIGQTWELPGLSWGLSLHYSSKIWKIGPPLVTNEGTLSRRGAYGVGWLLSMGRVFEDCRDGCNATLDKLVFEDQQGTRHPIYLDAAARNATLITGHTTD